MQYNREKRKAAKMPCDPKPVTVVTCTADRRLGTVIKVSYIPHWATCPKSADFKRPRKGALGTETFDWEEADE
jgi:hypothetical protein